MDKEEQEIKDFLDRAKDTVLQLKDVGIEQFRHRINNLENNIRSFSKHTIKSGLVGITSSGKSSLLNVLLGKGEKILKEQSKATTNMLVFCAKAEEPFLEIIFENGESKKTTGKGVFTESLWKYTSEDENPQNKYGVKYIKLGLPSFILQGDLEIADTPGLDAYGHKEHEDLTLREFLPQADLIIYLSSVRSPMKEADRKILNKIMDADQRIIFAQTCKGAVVGSNVGGDGSESIEESLKRHKEEFERAISHYSRLKDAPIVQVETTTAIKYFKDKDESAWQDSGFEEFVHVTKNVTKQLQYEYTLKSLKRIVDEINSLNTLIINAAKDEKEKKKSIEEEVKKLEKLVDYYKKIIHIKDNVVGNWRKKLDYISLYEIYSKELQKTFSFHYEYNPVHDREFVLKAEAISEKTQRMKHDLLETLDNAKEKFREYFDDIGLDVRRTDIQGSGVQSFFLPNVQKKQVSDALNREKGSSGSLLAKGREVTAEYIDKNKFIKDLKESLNHFFAPLIGHLDWWDKTVSFSFVDPLYKKTLSLKDDIENIEKGATYDEVQYAKLVGISKDLHRLVRSISHLCDSEAVEEKFPAYGKYTKKTTVRREKAEFQNLFFRMCIRLYEGLFHNYYIDTLSNFTEKSEKSILLVGQNHKTQVDFINRLLKPGSEHISILNESIPPYALNSSNGNGGIKNIDLGGDLSNSLSFYILNNDNNSFDIAESSELFEKADVIQVVIDDLHRVASALSDIVDRNVFFNLMKKYEDKLLLTYPGGASFQKERLHILVDEAIVEVEKVFSPHNIRWFIYENYEVRYNYFYEVALMMRYDKLSPEECLTQWKEMEIPLDDPFTEKILLEQFAELSFEPDNA